MANQTPPPDRALPTRPAAIALLTLDAILLIALATLRGWYRFFRTAPPSVPAEGS